MSDKTQCKIAGGILTGCLILMALSLCSCATEFYEKMDGKVDPDTSKLVAVNRTRYLRNSFMENTQQESHLAKLGDGVELGEAKTKKDQQGVPKSIARGITTMYTAGQMADGLKSMNDAAVAKDNIAAGVAKDAAAQETARKAIDADLAKSLAKPQ